MSVIGVDNFIRRSGVGEHRAGLVLGKTFRANFTTTGWTSAPDRASWPWARSDLRAPLSTHWMSDELVADTRRVWSKAYGRVISDEEVVEILTNVRKLAEVLLRT
jgi:hypothetical protein